MLDSFKSVVNTWELNEGLDAGQAKVIKTRICEQTGITERTLRGYLDLYKKEGFNVLKPKGRGKRCSVKNLDCSQFGESVKRHMANAGNEHNIFADNSIDEIFKFSSEAARLVNKGYTHSLLYGAQNQRNIIDDHMVKLVVQG